LLHNDNNHQSTLHQRQISPVFFRTVQGVDCSFNHVTQQGVNHFANDPTHPLDLLLHVFQFFATSFQMDSMNVRAAQRPRCCRRLVTRALQVVLEKHQASKALGPGCLSVLHMFAPRNIGLASAGLPRSDVTNGAFTWRVACGV
jgi:hypothetical protein